jgi:hypothetical protein
VGVISHTTMFAPDLNASGAEVLDTILKSDAVSFEEERLDIADLVLLGLMSNTWARFERDVSRRLALQRSGHDAIGARELKARATEFRYQRRLLSASEFRSWLAARSLSVGELSGVLARTQLRVRHHDEGMDVEVRRRAGRDAACRGTLRRHFQNPRRRGDRAHGRGPPPRSCGRRGGGRARRGNPPGCERTSRRRHRRARRG